MQVGATAVPEFTVTPRPAGQPATLIVACDGLWDVLTNDEAAAITRRTDCTDAAEELVFAAVERESGDNITAVVATLPAV